MKGPEGCPRAAWDINIPEGCRFSWQKIESLEHFLLDNAALNFYFIPTVTLRIHGEMSNNSSLFCPIPMVPKDSCRETHGSG